MSAPTMATSAPDQAFTLSHRSLKLTTAEDISPHIAPLRAPSENHDRFASISLNGNTLGPSASASLAPLLSAQGSLRAINLADIFTGRL